MVYEILIQLAIMIVASYVIAAMQPKPEQPKAATLDDFDAPTAEDGRPIPVIFGTVWIKGPNVIWYGDLRSSAIRK